MSRILNFFLPNILWRMPDQNIYLTFDDGPDKDFTPKLLDLLQIFEIKATFFLVGQKAELYPDIVLQIKNSGHTIGNHSFSHIRMFGRSKQYLIHEVNKTDEALFKITGRKPFLFRPPYGIFGINLLRILKFTKHTMVLWSVSVGDYKNHITAQKIQHNLIKFSRPGQIVLLHDGHPNSPNMLKALEEILGELKQRGVIFSSIDIDSEAQNSRI